MKNINLIWKCLGFNITFFAFIVSLLSASLRFNDYLYNKILSSFYDFSSLMGSNHFFFFCCCCHHIYDNLRSIIIYRSDLIGIVFWIGSSSAVADFVVVFIGITVVYIYFCWIWNHMRIRFIVWDFGILEIVIWMHRTKEDNDTLVINLRIRVIF